LARRNHTLKVIRGGLATEYHWHQPAHPAQAPTQTI
jgi:hypothetical protein